MKERFRLVCLGDLGGMFYCKDTVSGSRTSLKTKDRKTAEKLIRHKNEAVEQPHINRRIGLAYLSGADPELAKRTWKFVMEDIIKDKTGSTLHRYKTALKDQAYKSIQDTFVEVPIVGHLKVGEILGSGLRNGAIEDPTVPTLTVQIPGEGILGQTATWFCHAVPPFLHFLILDRFVHMFVRKRYGEHGLSTRPMADKIRG